VVFYGTLVSVGLTLLAVPAVYSLIARRTRSPEHMSHLVDKLLGQPSQPAPPLDEHRPRSAT